MNEWANQQTESKVIHEEWKWLLPRVGQPLSEPGLSFFALLDTDFFTDEWQGTPVVRSNSQTPRARVHMRSHVKIPSERKGNVEKNPFSTIRAFVGLLHPFQKLFLCSDTLTCIILQYWLSHHIQELEISPESHLFHLPMSAPPPSVKKNT